MSTSYNTPKAMAESMLKRFLQFKRALPADDNREVFKLILDNRYKLLGNKVTAAQRKELIDNSLNALSLLTLNTMMAEDNSLKESLKGNASSIHNILKEIYDIVSKEVKKETDFESQLKAAENQFL